jgi:hypothetical protein
MAMSAQPYRVTATARNGWIGSVDVRARTETAAIDVARPILAGVARQEVDAKRLTEIRARPRPEDD